jgi:phosphate-selective porin OprO/OprP
MAFGLGVIGLGAIGNAAAFELEPGARLHLDYADHDADARPLKDRGIVRRATLGLKGKLDRDWSFDVAYELSSDGDIRPDDGEFKDVALAYDGWSVGELTAGQFKIPFGLDELTSSNDIPLIERALPVDAFAPSRRLGVGFSRKQDAYTLSAMVFGSSIDGDDRGRGAAVRATVAPMRSAATAVHLGIAAVTERPRSKVDFDTAPESRVADVDLVNTGGIDDVHGIHRVGLEAAWRTGPASIQAEWMRASIQRDAGRPDASFDGWYVAGSWVLTGESRPYKHGRFKGIEPSRPTGAWELTARYSRIDLGDGDVRGGEQDNVAVGLNYCLNEHLRIMLNHIQVRSQRRGQTDDPSLLMLRVQMVF